MNMVSKLNGCLNSLKNLLFPIKCDLCGETVDTSGLCPECWKKISWISDPKCAICGTPFEIDVSKICTSCLNEKPKFDRAISVFKYDNFSKEIILKLKHFDTTHIAKRLSMLMYKTAQIEIDNSDLIVPVPIHFTKRLKRKYNQSEFLAKNIGEMSDVKYEPRFLKKIKITPQQEGLSAKNRKKNVVGSFGVDEKYSGFIENKKIILVDDVFTTGSTVDECSKILKKYKAESITVVTIAKVIF